MMQTAHLFAGRGGGLLSDLILGHNPILAVEWNHEACDNLREKATEGWYPDLHVYEGDVRLFDPSEYKGRVDCLHAGFPCQDISHAGNQAGVGEGTRSGLYREVLRIAGIIRPKYLFLENVAAIVTNGLGTVLGDISAMGYDARWCIVSASDVGANHQRERWWCLCILRDSQSNTDRQSSTSRRQWQSVGTEEIGTGGSIRRRSLCNDRAEITSNVGNTARVNGERNLPQARIVRGTQRLSGESDSTSGIHKAGVEHRQETGSHADAANTKNVRRSVRGSKQQQPISVSRKAWNESEGGSNGNAANTNGTRHNTQEQSSVHTTQKRTGTANNIADADWWSAIP